MNEIIIPLEIEPLDEGGFLAISPVWTDLLAQGRTIAETIEIAQDVARRLIESYREHGDALPQVLAQSAEATSPLAVNIAVPDTL